MWNPTKSNPSPFSQVRRALAVVGEESLEERGQIAHDAPPKAVLQAGGGEREEFGCRAQVPVGGLGVGVAEIELVGRVRPRRFPDVGADA
jgi:hypothetical protein